MSSDVPRRSLLLDEVRRPAGEGRCLIVAHVVQAPQRKPGMAHAFIEVIAKRGADAAKRTSQLPRARVSSPAASSPFFRMHSRYDYWERMEFSGISGAGSRSAPKNGGSTS